jgi:hypothetical protein
VGQVLVDGKKAGNGPETVAVAITNTNKPLTERVEVSCT